MPNVNHDKEIEIQDEATMYYIIDGEVKNRQWILFAGERARSGQHLAT